MKVYFYLTVSLVVLAGNFLAQAVNIRAITPYTTTASSTTDGEYDRQWTLAQTESQIKAEAGAEAEAQAQFIMKLFNKIVDHLFPIEQNMHARIGSQHVNCIDQNVSKVTHGKKGKIKVKGGNTGGMNAMFDAKKFFSLSQLDSSSIKK